MRSSFSALLKIHSKVQVAEFDSDAVTYREVGEVSWSSLLCNTNIKIRLNKLYTCISKCVTIMRSTWRSQSFQTHVGYMQNVSIQVKSNLQSVLLRHNKISCVRTHTRVSKRICVMLQMILLIKLQKVRNCAKTWKPGKTLHFTPKV